MNRTGATLVIPAWDEAETIGAVLDEVPRDLLDSVIVVVGSEIDPTGSAAARHGARVLVQRARGYGAACLTGAEAALADGAKIIAFLDGDYSDPPGELGRILRPIQAGAADLVVGCRDLVRHPHALPRHAKLGNAIVCLLIRALTHKEFRDLPSYKAIRADALRSLDMREMTYGWTVEMLVKASRRNLRITQLSILYRPRLGGHSKVAGDARASLAAAFKLLGCAMTYATSNRWSTARGESLG